MDKPKVTLLVVDDSLVHLHLLVQILRSKGYRICPARDGLMALAYAQADPPDLILLDIVMPEMSGYDVCRKLKADERTRDIPIIFISGLDEALDKVKAFSVGGVDYVTKPFQPEEVLARVETHLTLRNLQKSLQQQIVELDAFAQTVAHDLRAPLSVITGYGSILAEELAGTQNKLVQKGVNAIVKTGSRMGIIINELLLLASVRKMEEVELEPLDMATIVSGVRERLAIMIAEHRAEIILPRAWPVALGYGPWVEEVWSNYISNAIQHGGQPPRVELGASLSCLRGTRGGQIRFWVRDNGYGLTEEEREQLFTEFARLHQVRVRGYGLGLSIVRRIVEKLGGQVGVESEMGQGSVFYFTLPAVPEAQPMPERDVSADAG